jgi:hypothetical protein
VAPPDPETAQARPGKHTPGPALMDQVCRRQQLARAWEQGQQHRGRAGRDDGTIAPGEARQACSLERLPRQRRAGTDRPPPVPRGASPTSAGGGRTRGIPAVRERGGPPALVQRMEPLVAPTCLDSAVGSRRGRSPQEARRQGWGERTNGHGWSVAADRRPVCDPIDQARRLDVIAAASRDGRVRPRVRDRRRAGVREGGAGSPPGPVCPPAGGPVRCGPTSSGPRVTAR